MKNIKVTLNANILTVVIDLSQRFGKSQSGKTTIVASTEGNQPLNGEDDQQYYLGVNVYTK